jgi:hypothetical protein
MRERNHPHRPAGAKSTAEKQIVGGIFAETQLLVEIATQRHTGKQNIVSEMPINAPTFLDPALNRLSFRLGVLQKSKPNLQ